MSHVSPLLWLCSLSAALLSSYTALDPSGVYAEYLDRLDADTPAISAFFAAAREGVYPWTLPADPADPADPPSTAEPDAAPEPEIPAEPEAPAEPISPFATVDAAYFDDALFIGDSHTAGFHDYAGLRNATYFTKNGITVKEATEKSFVDIDGKKYTLAEALETRQFAKIYILLGLNELGGGTTDGWAQQYRTLLELVREKQPDAIVFIQSMFHTTQKKSDSSYFKNEAINERNAAIARLADNETVFYLPVHTVFDDESGVLRADYSGDGVHVRAPYYVEWRDYLYQFGVVRKPAEPSAEASADAPAEETPSGETN